MTQPLLVSTECPSCGAPLDFTEGSNAVRCLHCRSNLLITGRKQVLSYHVPPKVGVREAEGKLLNAIKEAGGGGAVEKSALFFLPYYRLTGHEFRWEAEPSVPETSSFQEVSLTDGLGREILRSRRGVSSDSTASALGAGLGQKKGLVLVDRYIERNFVACGLEGAGLYSLGVRPSVLRFELFRKERLASWGKIVAPSMTPEAAMTHGLQPGSLEPIIDRTVLGSVLSIIYFPFWIMELGRTGKMRMAILDAVSESVVTLEAPISVFKALGDQPIPDPQVVSFRPLTCPNCGWDLPLRPDDAIFFCSSCQRIWQLLGSRFFQVACEIAEIQKPGGSERGQYLPFWVLERRVEESLSFRFFLPAFRYRRLKHLVDLASRLLRSQPSYAVAEGEKPELQGCYYDQEDAARLAEFLLVGLPAPTPKKVTDPLEKGEPSTTIKGLTWLPFGLRGNFLVDPFTGFNLARNLLL